LKIRTPLKTTSVLGPNHFFDVNFTGSDALATDQYTALMKGELALCVWTDILYQDTFGSHRSTHYRAFFRGNGMQPQEPVPLTQAAGNNAS